MMNEHLSETCTLLDESPRGKGIEYCATTCSDGVASNVSTRAISVPAPTTLDTLPSLEATSSEEQNSSGHSYAHPHSCGDACESRAILTAVPARQVLPPFDVQRFHFWRVLTKAPRSGGQIELHLDRLAGVIVAVKRVPASRARESPEAYCAAFPHESDDPWRELNLSLRFGQPGISEYTLGVCPCYGAFMCNGGESHGDLLLISEYVPNGDLFAFISKMSVPGACRQGQSLAIVRSLLKTMLHLHQSGIAHGDISLENVLKRSDSTDQVLLVDFAMAITENLAKATGSRGKASYQAPEMHTKPFYDACAGDLFACGVLAYALVVGRYPWSSTRPNQCRAFGYAQSRGIDSFLEKRRVSVGSEQLSVKEYLSDEFYELLTVLLSLVPEKRYEAYSSPRLPAGLVEV